MYDGITTSALDNLSAETCAYMNIIHPSYSMLAARLAVSNLHKDTKANFAETIKDLTNYIDIGTSNFFIKNIFIFPRIKCQFDR